MAVGDFLRQFAHGIVAQEIDPNGGMAVDATRIYWGIRGGGSPSSPYGIHFYDLEGVSEGGLTFSNPSGIICTSLAVDDTHIYALRGDKIQRYLKSTLAYVDEFGTNGAGDGEWDFPDQMTVDDTRIYVADHVNERVGVFNKSSFAWITNITPQQGSPSPRNVAVDVDSMYIADNNAASNNVERYNKTSYAFIDAITVPGLAAALDSDGTYISVYNETEVKVYLKSDYSLVATISYAAQFYGGVKAANREIYLTGASTGPLKIYEGAEPMTPTNLAATCVKESVPEPRGFTMTIISEEFPMTVQFNSGLGSGYTYAWESGNGDTSTDEEPIFEYPSAGNYEVRLRATNSFGSWTFTQPAIIDTEHSIDMPIALFTADVQAGVSPLAVVFTDNSTGDISDWEWYVDDVLESSVQAFSHTFTSDGTYIVRLKVIGSGEAEAEMTVRAGPLANLPPIVTLMGATETKSIIGSLTTIFSATVDGVVDTYLWEFGNGFSSSDASPEYNYSQPGTYTARLTVTNTEGSTSASFTIRVMHLPAMEKAEVGAYIGSDKIGFYAVDALNNKVLIYKSETEFITSFGSPGSGEGQFNNPTGMTVVGGVRLIDSIEI